MVDAITREFARRYPDWCEKYAPLDLDHFDGFHHEEPFPGSGWSGSQDQDNADRSNPPHVIPLTRSSGQARRDAARRHSSVGHSSH